MRGAIRLFTFCSLLALASAHAFGQDLGSSNKLFSGTKKGKSSTAPTRKTAVKRKAAARSTTASSNAKPRARSGTATATSKTHPRSTTASSKVEAKPKSTPSKVVKEAGNASIQTEKKPVPSRFSGSPPQPAGNSNAATDEQFEKLIESGNDARDDRNYSAAEAAYQRAKSLKPRDSRAIFGLGNIYADQQRWDDAESAYRGALKLDPDNAIDYIALSYVLSQPIMVSDLSERYEEAEHLARRSIELAPRNALAFDQLGVALELRGIISSETENAYHKSISLDPSFAPPYAHLGRLLRRRGLTDESAAAYESAIQHSTDVATMILVADVMQSEQRFAESESLLRHAVSADPRNPTGLLLLGRALTAVGNFAEAETILRKSLDVSPNTFMPNVLLGTLYSRQGKYELAENALLQSLRSVSANEKRRLSLQFETVGDGYMKAGKKRNAERVYRQAIALDTENEHLAAKLTKAKHS